LIGLSWALLLVPSLPHSETVTLNPDKDNTLCQQDDGSKSNALGDIYVGRTGEESSISERRGVISFDVAAVVPAGATINSATLRLYLSRVNISSAANISIYKASATWGEGTSYYDD